MPGRATAIPSVHSSRPRCAIEGGRITITGAGFPIDGPALPEVRIGDVPARPVFGSSTQLDIIVPAGLESGRAPIRIAGVAGETRFVDVAAPFATGLHQVDNPAFDRAGNLYVTFSGSRGEHVPVSIFRVRANGTRETYASGIVNPTSMAIGPDGWLYVSSRFEGTVYRIAPDGAVEPFATDLGVACGLAFAPDGALFVGDRSGTIFRVDSAARTTTIATLPASVAAFHLAVSPDGAIYVTGPTLSAYDAVYRVDPDGTVTTRYAGFGRPQGIAFDARGTLFVVEALAGASGLYRMPAQGDPELVLSGPGLVGVAFDSLGTLVVSSNETAYRLKDGVPGA